MAEPNLSRAGRPAAPATAGRRMPPAAPRLAAGEQLFEERPGRPPSTPPAPATPPAPPSGRAQTVEEARARFCARYLPELIAVVLGEVVEVPQTVEAWYALAGRVRDVLDQPAMAAPYVARWLAEALEGGEGADQ